MPKLSAIDRFTSTQPAATRVWFGLSLAFATLYGLLCWHQSIGAYVVQDDARQHVFWMRRFLDPGLFPGDLIADYFQSVAPAGYTWIYRLPTLVGIDPLLWGKLLPLGLGLVMTVYSFGLVLEMLPVPIAGFISALLLNQTLWMKDGLASATPRAFAIPLLLAFGYYLVRRSWLPCLGTIALLGLIYPHNAFIAAGVLLVRLIPWQGPPDGFDRRLGVAGLGVLAIVLLPYAWQSAEFGPTVTPEMARLMPEFGAEGRSPFFHANPLEFWLDGRGSGYFPSGLPPLVLVGLLLPVWRRWPRCWPLVQQLTGAVAFLPQLLLAATGMFFLAHLLLFRLHLPNRYTGASLRIVIVLAAGLALTVLLEAVLRWRWGWLVVGAVAIALVGYPATLNSFPNTRFLSGSAPALYEFLAQQPRDTLVASLSEEADNLPTFARRSTLTGREYGVPFQVGYYQQIRQRAEQLIDAQYSPTLTAAQALIDRYGIDFWLLDRPAFSAAYLRQHRWLRLFETARDRALAHLQAGPPALERTLPRCQVLDAPGWVLLQASCIAEAQ